MPHPKRPPLTTDAIIRIHDTQVVPSEYKHWQKTWENKWRRELIKALPYEVDIFVKMLIDELSFLEFMVRAFKVTIISEGREKDKIDDAHRGDEGSIPVGRRSKSSRQPLILYLQYIKRRDEVMAKLLATPASRQGAMLAQNSMNSFSLIAEARRRQLAESKRVIDGEVERPALPPAAE